MPLIVGLILTGCATKNGFRLNHDYPAPPSIKRLTEPGACLGGEKLAAVDLSLPEYPLFAKRQGRQGWAVIRLDVLADGQTANVDIRQSAPGKIFDRVSKNAVRKWRFKPVGGKGLSHCLVFIDYRLGQVRIGQ